MALAPSHQLLAGEARVGPDQDLDLRPRGADLGHDALELLDAALRGIDVRAPEPRQQQVVAAEDVERQVAVVAVVAVEEAALLGPVEGIIRGIEIEDDGLRGLLEGAQEELDEERVHRLRYHRDPAVAILGSF